jgi:hypothetical protein
MASRHYMPRDFPFAFTNGIQCSYVEVDTETGFVKLAPLGAKLTAQPFTPARILRALGKA